MKIFCVGWNYNQHNKEMNHALNSAEPTIFMKPQTAILKDGRPFFMPGFSKQMEYEAELVIRLCRVGKNVSPKFAHRYYDAFTIGIDFTARDLQHKLRANGQPWELSKGFDNSAAIGEFVLMEEFDGSLMDLNFHLDLNGETVQAANSAEMIFSIDQIIAYVSQFYTLKIGDLIFTGTPAGVGTVKIGDQLQGFIGENKLLDFYVR